MGGLLLDHGRLLGDREGDRSGKAGDRQAVRQGAARNTTRAIMSSKCRRSKQSHETRFKKNLGEKPWGNAQHPRGFPRLEEEKKADVALANLLTDRTLEEIRRGIEYEDSMT